VQNERVAGKHRQRVLMHLGQHATVEAAMEAWAKHARVNRAIAAGGRKQGRGSYAQRVDEKAKALEEKVERLKLLSGD
jgi:hypothetical protein